MLDTPPRLLVAAPTVATSMVREGYALIAPAGLESIAGTTMPEPAITGPVWGNLPPDGYLRDGGHYRRRRHASLIVETATGAIHQAPQRAHWQPVDYNALHGGLERWYEPIEPALLALPAWQALVSSLGTLLAGLSPTERWYVEAHQFRIDTVGGIGRPTPEGAHRDGVDFVAVILIERHAVKGGETRVFESGGPRGLRFTMVEPWTTLLLDDNRVIHETSPVQPLGVGGYRDTLVLTYRAEGFLGPRAAPTGAAPTGAAPTGAAPTGAAPT